MGLWKYEFVNLFKSQAWFQIQCSIKPETASMAISRWSPPIMITKLSSPNMLGYFQWIFFSNAYTGWSTVITRTWLGLMPWIVLCTTTIQCLTMADLSYAFIDQWRENRCSWSWSHLFRAFLMLGCPVACPSNCFFMRATIYIINKWACSFVTPEFIVFIWQWLLTAPKMYNTRRV